MSKQYGVKNFIHIANDYVNPDTTTIAGIEKFLIGWFCFKFDTVPSDEKLLDMTTEELMVLYQMHRIKDDPQYFDEQTNEKQKGYEDWLKEEMGDAYVSEEQNIQEIQASDKEFTERVRSQFPDKVETDFSQFQKD